MLKLLAISMALILLAAACFAADKAVSDDKIWDQVSIKLTGDPVAGPILFVRSDSARTAEGQPRPRAHLP